MNIKYQVLINEIHRFFKTINIKCNSSEIDDLVRGLHYIKRENDMVLMKRIVENILTFAVNNKEQICEERLTVFKEGKYGEYDIGKYIVKYETKFCGEELRELWAIVKKIIFLAADTN